MGVTDTLGRRAHPRCDAAGEGNTRRIEQMNKKMKAGVVHKFGQPLTIEEVAIPEPGEGDVLVKIEATGVCHTDLHAADGDWPIKPTPPFIPGHEGAGFVAAVGRGVKHVKEGDRVGIAWLHSACGHCEFCLTGWETLCPNQQMSGYTVNGTFAEYALGSADYIAQLPANVSFVDIAPILCAGVTTYKGLKETQARPGEWVVISGVGGLGHVAVQYAKAMGMHVAAVDLGADKMSLARSLGADITIDAATEDPAIVIQKKIGGAHGVLVTAVSLGAFRQALGMLRRGGTCVLCGLPPGEFPISIFDLVLNGHTLRGSIVGTRKDLAEALEFAAEGKVKATIETLPLESINTIFDRLKHGKVNGRIVLDLAHSAAAAIRTAA
jgi:propanol-preferring alcohol dehydrogenase